MSRQLIKEIQVWSVIRTLFPLGWIWSTIIAFGGILMVGRMITGLASECTELPAIDGGIGVVAGILGSIILGLFGAIAITLLAVIFVIIYNFLAALGGGFTIHLQDTASPPYPEDQEQVAGQEEES